MSIQKQWDDDDEPMLTGADLYPMLTPEQQEEAMYHLDRYLKVVFRIFLRLHGLEKGNPYTEDPVPVKQ
jgi:hypothetical protein